MTRIVIKEGECFIFGLSTDTKPTTSQNNGFAFFEIDTGKVFLCDGAAWDETTAAAQIPVGGITYTDGESPATLYGYGTWQLIGIQHN